MSKPLSGSLSRSRFVLLMAVGLFGLAILMQQLFTARSVQAVSTSVVISQVYGGGGNTSAQYQNDFVELFNRGTTTVSLTGWSVEYTSATGTGLFSQNAVTLSGSIGSGQYYLVKLASGGAVGAALPPADATSTTINMSATTGKVIVANTTSVACNGSST